MTIAEMRKRINDHNIPRFNMFYGDEQAVIDIYIDDIKAQFDSIIQCEHVYDVVGRLDESSLFDTSDTARLFIVRYDNDFMSNDSDWDSFKEAIDDSDCTVIIKYGKLDTKTKFYKHFESVATHFARMTENVIAKHLAKDYGMSQKYGEHLASICACDYGRVLLEADKALMLSKELNVSVDQAYKECYNSGTIYVDPSGTMFELCDSIMSGNIDDIQYDIESFKSRGDSILALISVLSNTVKATIQVMSFSDMRGICEKTGLAQYTVTAVKNYTKLHRVDTLIALMKHLLCIEKAIKIGELDSEYAVDYAILDILGVLYNGRI